MGPAHVENVADLACRTALSYRGVAHITFPIDLQEQEVTKQRPLQAQPAASHVRRLRAQRAALPAGERSAPRRRDPERRQEGRDPRRARARCDAGDELEQAAEVLGAPIIKALLGKAAVPDDSPYTTGGIGLLGTKPSQEALEDCDTLLMVGTSFPYIEFYPEAGQGARRADRHRPEAHRPALSGRGRAGRRQPPHAAGAAAAAAAARRTAASWRRRRTAWSEWWKLMEERGTRTDKPMKPQVVAWELGKRLSRQRHRLLRFGHDHHLVGAPHSGQARPDVLALRQPGDHGVRACRTPSPRRSPIPDRQCVAFVGDGGFSMLMAEFATAVKYKLPIKVVIIKNNTLGQIKWEQMVFLGNPEYGCRTAADRFRRVRAGLRRRTGFTIEDPGRLRPASLDQALATPGPVVVEARGRSVRAADARQDHRRAGDASSPSRWCAASRIARRSR